jgi:RHS repeat-associated protein
MGNRVIKNSSVNGNRKYIIDISGELPTILMEINPSNGDIMKTYVYANSQILMQHNGDHTADKYFYLHDRLGSVRLVIDADGTVRNSYTYDAFGESFDSEFAENISNPFKFTGQFYDDEISQYYLRARQYDPILMRWTARDTHERDFAEPRTLHRYLYCFNSPTYYVDLNGENFSIPDVLVSMSYGAGLGAWGGFWYGIAHEVFACLANPDREFDYGKVLEDVMSFALFGAIAGAGGILTPANFITEFKWALIAGEISGSIFGYREGAGEENAGKGSLTYIDFRIGEMQAGILLLAEDLYNL